MTGFAAAAAAVVFAGRDLFFATLIVHSKALLCNTLLLPFYYIHKTVGEMHHRFAQNFGPNLLIFIDPKVNERLACEGAGDGTLLRQCQLVNRPDELARSLE